MLVFHWPEKLPSVPSECKSVVPNCYPLYTRFALMSTLSRYEFPILIALSQKPPLVRNACSPQAIEHVELVLFGI